jgi:cell division protein FtsZ
MAPQPISHPTPVQHVTATMHGVGIAAPPRNAPAPSRTGLFADPSGPVSAAAPARSPAEPQRPSLFSTVTGAFRRRNAPSAAPVEPPAARPEPVMQEPRTEQPRASVRQTAGEEVGLDIPAFLRRQSS